jgi:serine/threonine-protein kinase
VDIYTLGCVGYWLLTGRLVFEAPNAIQLMYQHANAIPVPPSQRSELEIPPELDNVILACLAKHPEDRPETAGELAGRLSTAVPVVWTEEQAHRWWDRHHPESARAETTESDKRMLSKTMDAVWEPVETPAPTVGAGRP